MAVLAQGSLSDRPWGRTLAALAARGVSGQVNIDSGGKGYALVLDGGAVVGARSPLASDAVARLALTAGLVTSTHVAQHSRLARDGGGDEVELLARIAGLSPDVTARLRRRVIATQAIRSFALDDGQFQVIEPATLPGFPDAAIDMRAVLLHGARTHLREAALRAALGDGRWRLADDAAGGLAQFGLTSADAPTLQLLQDGASADELVVGAEDPRAPLAIAYALAMTGVIVGADQPAAAVTRAPAAPAAPVLPTNAAAPRSRSQTLNREPGSRAPTASGISRGPRARTTITPAMRAELEQLVAARAPMLDGEVDHFALLGVTSRDTPDAVRAAYFALAKQLHPDRLTASGLVDTDRLFQRLFAAVNEAFKVVSTPALRAEFERVQAGGGKLALRAKEAEAEATARRILLAEDHFRRGEMALRREALDAAAREFAEAARLHPEEDEYGGMLAWCTFATAPANEKAPLAAATRTMLERAARSSPKAVGPRLFLGRVERLLGNDAAAMARFREALVVSPGHSEATSELRILESRSSKTGIKR